MSQHVPIYFNIRYINSPCAQGAIYRFMIGGYHDSDSRALMIVSILPYIVILKHDLLLHAHYEYAIMNICIFME